MSKLNSARAEGWHCLAGAGLSNSTTCCCPLSHPQWSNWFAPRRWPCGMGRSRAWNRSTRRVHF